MTDEFALFLGCVIPARLPQVEISSRKVLELLGIKLHEMNGAGCCPEPISSQSLSIDLWTTLAARNLCIAESMGKDILTLCAGCFETLRTASNLLEEDPKLRNKINAMLKEIGMEYKGTSKVFHFIEVCSQPKYLEKIKLLVKNPLKELTLSSHYGCHLLRPSKIIKFDDPERPITMDKILTALGAKTIDTPEKMTCCGQCVKLDQTVGERLVKDKIFDAQNNLVDALSVVCPGCLTQLDQTQKGLNKELSDDQQLETPIMYLSELMAISMGVPIEKLQIKRRAIKPTALISKII